MLQAGAYLAPARQRDPVAMKTVLLAYEREQDLAALETLLEARGQRVIKSRSGVEALEIARREAPQVVMSDVLLPKLDGFALCRRVKEDPVLHHLPVVLLSFRVEGAKYEAFAAEVGAERFFPRGTTLEELATALDELSQGSGTMRMPALVPELLEKREQDRRRVVELERHVRDSRTCNSSWRSRSASPARVPSVVPANAPRLAAADAERIRELQARLHELESRERQLTGRSDARGAAQQSQAELARIGVLESRLAELQTARARAHAAAMDAERAFAAQPVPTWLSDMETHEIRAVSDSAAALFGLAAEALRGRSIAELLPGYVPDAESAQPIEVTLGPRGRQLARARTAAPVGVLRRAGLLADPGARRHRRACAARRARIGRGSSARAGACAVRSLPGRCREVACGTPTGRSSRWSTATPRRGGRGVAAVCDEDGDGTVRSMAVSGGGAVVHEGRWRRGEARPSRCRWPPPPSMARRASASSWCAT